MSVMLLLISNSNRVKCNVKLCTVRQTARHRSSNLDRARLVPSAPPRPCEDGPDRLPRASFMGRVGTKIDCAKPSPLGPAQFVRGD